MSERGAEFRRFQLTGGKMLDRIGIFQALSDQFGPDDAWWDWPELYRDCESAEVAKFATDHRDQIEFFQYLQWQANQQLRTAAQAARDAGMTIGLYHDLALAADSAGAELWMNRRAHRQEHQPRRAA